MFVIRIELLEFSPLEMIHKRNTIRVMMCLVIGINLKHCLPGVELHSDEMLDDTKTISDYKI